MNGLVRAVAVGLLAILPAACGSAFRQPEITLQNVQLAGLGLRGGTLLVNIEVVNPNRFALNTSELVYQLAIANTDVPGDTAWVELASGTYSEPVSVGAGATEVIHVPVEFTYNGLGDAASSVLRAGTFNYRATGTVDVRTPIGTRQVPFRKGGMVSLTGLNAGAG
jgi:LEA14-like dessication related protein